MAIRTLCEAGLEVCAINAGRRLDPRKDFRHHRMPWDMKFRGFGDPAKRAESVGFMDNEWVDGVWEHDIPFTTAPGTQWMWQRCFAVGGKTNFWGRSSARFGDIDFRAGSISGVGIDWPLDYRGNRALLQPRRTHDRRLEHRAKPAQQPGWRVSATVQFPLPRSHPADRCVEDRHSLSSRPNRTAHAESRGQPGLPLLRSLHDGLRHRLVLLDAVAFPAEGRGERTNSICAPTRWRRTSWSTRTAWRAASRTSIGPPGRRSRCARAR